jgi:hypothetical protein
MNVLIYYAAVDARAVKEGPGESIPSCRVALFSNITDDPEGFQIQVEAEHARMRRSFPNVPENVRWLKKVENYLDFQI